MNNKVLICGNKTLQLNNPIIMGILNIGNESFFDGGKYINPDIAIKRAMQIVQEGASIIDMGAESTKPNAHILPLEQEIQSLKNIVPFLVKQFENSNIVISIDTYKYQTMKVVLDLGVDMINDISAFTDNNSQRLISKYNCAICIMHMQNNPQTMQINPKYSNIVQEIKNFLYNSTQNLIKHNIDANRIIIDPGFGFGKNLQHNIELLKNFEQFSQLGFAVLAGLSRKSFLGLITNTSAEDRLSASISANLLAVQKGANIIRVHDVKQINDAIKVYQSIQ